MENAADKVSDEEGGRDSTSRDGDPSHPAQGGDAEPKSMPQDDVDESLEESNVSSPPHQLARPRAPQTITQPGAVAVPGIDGDTGDDYVTPTPSVVESQEPETDKPITAELVDAAEENRKVEKRIEKEVRESIARDRKEREKSVPTAEIVRNERFSPEAKLLMFTSLMVLVIVGVVLGVTLSRVWASTSEGNAIPEDLLQLLSSVSLDEGAALSVAGTPQNEAGNWLTNNAKVSDFSNARKIQRYALATLYFSTKGESWYNNAMWLSDADECEWYSDVTESFCSDSEVAELVLTDNGLAGSIPEEISLLSSLGKYWIEIAKHAPLQSTI